MIKASEFKLLPAAPGLCPECAIKHGHDEPHNKDSLFYQIQFKIKFGRFPEWSDAISHCTKEARMAWEKELKKRGVWK